MPKSLPLGSKRLNHSGYVQIKTTKGQRHWPFEHRVVWEAANGPIPLGHLIHHKNHDRSDNRLENLELCKSQSDHISIHHGDKLRERMRRIQSIYHHTSKTPEALAKLSATLKHLKALRPDVQQSILTLRSQGMSMKSIGSQLSISYSAVFRFLRNHGDVIPQHMKKNARWKFH